MVGCLSGQMGTAVSPAGQGSRVPRPGNHVLFGPCSAVKGCHSTRAKSHFRKEKNDLAGHSQMLIRAVGVGGGRRERGPFPSPLCIARAPGLTGSGPAFKDKVPEGQTM